MFPLDVTYFDNNPTLADDCSDHYPIVMEFEDSGKSHTINGNNPYVLATVILVPMTFYFLFVTCIACLLFFVGFVSICFVILVSGTISILYFGIFFYKNWEKGGGGGSFKELEEGFGKDSFADSADSSIYNQFENVVDPDDKDILPQIPDVPKPPSRKGLPSRLPPKPPKPPMRNI